MTFRPDDWPRVKALFDAALAVDGAARAAFVASSCGDDFAPRSTDRVRAVTA